MPYQSNSPRWEFNSTDRASLQTIGQQALMMMEGISPANGTSPVLRSDFDAWKNMLLALNPTYNATGPWPDTR